MKTTATTTARRSAPVVSRVSQVAALEAAISAKVGAGRYAMWFTGHTRFEIGETDLTIGVPNLHFQEWLTHNFSTEVRAAVLEVFDRPLEVRFRIDAAMFQQARAEQAAATPTEPPKTSPAPSPKSEPARKAKASRPSDSSEGYTAPKLVRKWKTLEDFVVGSCNRVAAASAISIVEEPGQGPNPLVIYGPVGTGKTHLLEGICVGLKKSFDGAVVRYATAEDFVNRFVAAMGSNRQASFRKYFRDCSVLLIDDLNFLASKKATQIEFLHTFDALVADGRQIVVTCDCHPRLTDDLMPELVDRLIGGAVWSLLPPDGATRLDILRSKSASANGSIPEDVLKFVADSLRGNVRELEGALHSLRHFSRVTGRKVDLPLAREALGDLLRHAVRVVSVPDVEAAVCAMLRLPHNLLRSKQRAWAVAHPRMMAIYLCRKHTAATYGEISIYFGNKTHSTAVAAEKKVRQWIAGDGSMRAGERDWRVRELLERIERELLR